MADDNPIKNPILKRSSGQCRGLAGSHVARWTSWLSVQGWCITERETDDGEKVLLFERNGWLVESDIARSVLEEMLYGYNAISADFVERDDLAEMDRIHGKAHSAVGDPRDIKNWNGYVYLMRQQPPGSDPIYKIGRTEGNHPSQRLKSLQLASGTPITLVAHAYVWNITIEEKFLHRRFASKRTIGEWFTLDDDDVAFVIAHLENRALPSSREVA